MKSTRSFSYLALALAAFAFSATAQSSHPLPRRPNIILIVANTMSAGDLSCYGQTLFQTPNLDKLAAGGIRFTHYSAGAPAGSPARAALLTGKDISLGTNDVTLVPNDITIAELLKNSGYFTSLIGEWDLGDQGSSGAPWLKGFNEFAGYFNYNDAADPYAQSIWRYECNPVHTDLQAYNGTEQVYANAGGQKVQYIPDWLTTLSMTFVKKREPDQFNHYRPFFLMLSCLIPGNGNRTVPTDAPFSEEPWPQAEKNRAAMISRLDNNIGQLLAQLDKIGQASNTVIFFTSDTVPQKAGGIDPKFFHENPSTNSLLVPMIVSWPGKIPAGQVSDLNCSAQDFLPTAAGFGLVAPPEKIDGTSFMPALFGKTKK
ncbi:MAG TPA: sulfatase-like hydrolase/transferase [Pseudomonadales bacterium]|nr:sulfatase-like hydrolase/transferase [Pseudomonadales bacterium]